MTKQYKLVFIRMQEGAIIYFYYYTREYA